MRAWSSAASRASRRIAAAPAGSAWRDEVVQDLRYAARVMRRAPGFTVTAIGTIALCLGANLAIFAVVNAVLLRPLPFPQSERLVRIYNTYPKAGVPDDGASVANYYERRGRDGGALGACRSIAKAARSSASRVRPSASR